MREVGTVLLSMIMLDRLHYWFCKPCQARLPLGNKASLETKIAPSTEVKNGYVFRPNNIQLSCITCFAFE